MATLSQKRLDTAMTSFLLAGYLAVSGGRRLSSENPTTHKTTHHVYYDTVIQTAGTDVHAEIRTWAPNNEPVLADGTIVDIVAKVSAPSNGKVLLDSTQFWPFPGDPNDATYEDHVPERPFPTLFVLGHTVGSPDTMDDGISIGYPVQTAEYVRDQSRVSRVYCRFDGTKPRWKKTPRPSSGSAVYVVGIAYGLHLAGGDLMLDVDQVQLNVGSTQASASPARIESGGPVAKRRRFPTGAAAAQDPSSAPSSSRTENPFATGTQVDASTSTESSAADTSSEQALPKGRKAAAAAKRVPRGAARRDDNTIEE